MTLYILLTGQHWLLDKTRARQDGIVLDVGFESSTILCTPIRIFVYLYKRFFFFQSRISFIFVFILLFICELDVRLYFSPILDPEHDDIEDTMMKNVVLSYPSGKALNWFYHL